MSYPLLGLAIEGADVLFMLHRLENRDLSSFLVIGDTDVMVLGSDLKRNDLCEL